jgi:hypothetical protein
MKNKLAIILFTLSTFFSLGQVVTTYNFTQKLNCNNYMDSTETLRYTCSPDTLYIMTREITQACPNLSTSIEIVGDTLRIKAFDISNVQCWSYCMTIFKYKIWGLIPKYYFAKHIGVYYPIQCWATGISEYQQFPTFTIKENVLNVDYNKPLKIYLSDINGRILFSTTEKQIDLKQINLTPGLYFIGIDSENYSGHRKILIE